MNEASGCEAGSARRVRDAGRAGSCATGKAPLAIFIYTSGRSPVCYFIIKESYFPTAHIIILLDLNSDQAARRITLRWYLYFKQIVEC